MSVETWIAVIEAAGISADHLDHMQAYTLSDKLTKDSEVVRHKEKLVRKGVLPMNSSVTAIRSMSAGARTALRQRVGY